MELSHPSIAFLAPTLFGLVFTALSVLAMWVVRRRKVPAPTRFPSVSLIKPLCGLDDELELNLESHAQLDYPGPLEILLGVRSEQDPAYPIAVAFAARHPERIRVVIQTGEPGHNPKVNQLISLTRASRNEVIVLTDSNVRVPRHYLHELVALLEEPNVGLATNMFLGVGERRLGAALDNMTLASFASPNLALAELALPNDMVVGKSLAIPRTVLEKMGGWHTFKDVLAEDHQMGKMLAEFGLHSKICPTPVFNVQMNHPVASYWKRHSRWAMIRFRVLIPGVLLEPLLNPILWALLVVAFSPASWLAWILLGAVALTTMVLTQVAAVLARGHGFALKWLVLVPFRDVMFFLIWLRGATLRSVEWRGNKLRVLANTRLAAPEAILRVKNMQRLGR